MYKNYQKKYEFLNYDIECASDNLDNGVDYVLLDGGEDEIDEKDEHHE